MRMFGPLVIVFLALGYPSMALADKPADKANDSETQAPAEELSNKLKWATATEVDNFGFDVFRSESEEGPFEKLNAEPIPGQGTTDEPTSYEYVDRTIAPNTAYYYYIESISFANEREKFTPTFRAPPKSPAEDNGKPRKGDG